MATATRLLTAEDLYELAPDLRCELVDGVLIELPPPGNEHSRVSMKAGLVLARAESIGLGIVLGEGGYIVRRGPDTVRAPDAAFFVSGRVDPAQLPEGFSEIVPDLVVEVVSPWDSRAEIQAKIREWLEAGVRLVLYVYPRTRTLHAIRSLTDREELTSSDILDFEDVLPGFSCPVSDFFD
jgi:Uma2 family endonuclease